MSVVFSANVSELSALTISVKAGVPSVNVVLYIVMNGEV